MKLINKIKTWWIDRQRRKIVENMLDNKRVTGIKKNNLMKGIVKSSKIIADEIDESAKQIKAHEDKKLYADLKGVIEKHFANVEKKYENENKKLHVELDKKNMEIFQMKKNRENFQMEKNRVTETLLN